MVLRLEKRGCDFVDDSAKKLSDVGNYRVTTSDYSVMGKDGNLYFLEILGGHPSYTYRTTNKRNGKELKKAVKELRNINSMSISFTYQNERGCYGNNKLWSAIYNLNLSYTIENILKAVNMVSADNYDSIEFLN